MTKHSVKVWPTYRILEVKFLKMIKSKPLISWMKRLQVLYKDGGNAKTRMWVTSFMGHFLFCCTRVIWML